MTLKEKIDKLSKNIQVIEATSIAKEFKQTVEQSLKTNILIYRIAKQISMKLCISLEESYELVKKTLLESPKKNN